MRLTKISVQNYRSIKNSGEVAIEPLQALVGENNCGKSNVLRAIQCFLSSGAGGAEASDFNDPASPVIIECEFGGLSAEERARLRPYASLWQRRGRRTHFAQCSGR
jgi:putative ATP-dependent endonuclease of the OLD family